MSRPDERDEFIEEILGELVELRTLIRALSPEVDGEGDQ